MRILLDTQMILWATMWPEHLPRKALSLINDADDGIFFSPASIWEVVIKNEKKLPGFHIDARVLRRKLLENGSTELAITSEHAMMIGELALLHKDPFDRILLAQAKAEGISLLTSDIKLSEYDAPTLYIRKNKK